MTYPSPRTYPAGLLFLGGGDASLDGVAAGTGTTTGKLAPRLAGIAVGAGTTTGALSGGTPLPATYTPGPPSTGVIEPVHVTGIVEPIHTTGAVEPVYATGVLEFAHTTGIVEATHTTGALEQEFQEA